MIKHISSSYGYNNSETQKWQWKREIKSRSPLKSILDSTRACLRVCVHVCNPSLQIEALQYFCKQQSLERGAKDISHEKKTL